MGRAVYVLLSPKGLPYVSLRRGSDPMLGRCADIESAKRLMSARLEAERAARGGRLTVMEGDADGDH